MDIFEERSAAYLSHKREWTDFLEHPDFDYAEKINIMRQEGRHRLLVNMNDIRQFNAELARRFLLAPTNYFAPFQAALREIIRILPQLQQQQQQDNTKIDRQQYGIGLEGSFGSNRLSPRELAAHHLGQLVCIEGIATKCSTVRPKVVKTVHHCAKTGVYQEMNYHDATSLTGFPTSSVYPTKDSNGNPLTTEFGLSLYCDHQTLSIQEMPERSPAGLLPSSIDVVLDDDLVDRCKPGDRVQIIGIYRALPSKSGAEGSGTFKSILIANHIRPLMNQGQIGDLQLSERDIADIRKLSSSPDIFHILSASIAPSIYGLETIKQALLLLLLGGVEKNLENGTHIRGDINLLMVGDPSTAKSQLLRYVLNVAPLALNTTGRGSSGVGLTAAVTSDRETGDRRLEAGAMVLADRGVVCIDEFDKMSDVDRVAIHEVMEQQTVTIAKAGIHMSLNARCSVVAAANPRYSQYDKHRSPAFNVNLPDSLLSRFDLLFIVLDEPKAEDDRKIADRVLNNHRYNNNKGIDQSQLYDQQLSASDDLDLHSASAGNIYQKYDSLLHSNSQSSSQRILTMTFLKKYISFAKTTFSPLLTEEATALIGDEYAALRLEQANKMNGYPITARCLETLIRLSTAHAKLRLSDEVEESDVLVALQVLKQAMNGSKDKKERDNDEKEQREAAGEGSPSDDSDDPDHPPHRRHRRRTSQEEDEQKRKAAEDEVDGDEDDTEHKQDSASKGSSRRRTRSSAAMTDVDDGVEDGEGGAADDNDSPRKRGRAAMEVESEGSPSVRISTDRLRDLTHRLSVHMTYLFESAFEDAFNAVNEGLRGKQRFSKEEMESGLYALENQSRIMYRDGVIHKL